LYDYNRSLTFLAEIIEKIIVLLPDAIPYIIGYVAFVALMVAAMSIWVVRLVYRCYQFFCLREAFTKKGQQYEYMAWFT
jgi:hypothetical protein